MAAAALADVNQCLQWIGFIDANQRNSIIDEAGLSSLRDLFDVSEVDIRDMAESFSKRSPANTRIIFGMRRIKWLIAMMHWAQDFKRCSLVPVLDDINNADEFKEVLQVSAQRATLRKTDTDQVDTISKAADPGKFKDEKKWPDWEPAFVNYLSTIPGVEGIPLSYVVRANDAPDHQTEFGDDFISRSVACAPLQGAAFRADARKVHQLLMNFLVAESAEQWIRGHVNQVNGRLDMVALRNHYSGEGNASRRIATAEKLRETLHYKSEHSLPFNTFLDRMQKMFNIFKEEGEPIPDNAQIRELFKRVQHPQLQDTVKALRVRFDLDGITYTEAANHLTAAVSELPEYQLARRTSSVQRVRGGGNRGGGGDKGKKKHQFKRESIYEPDGSIFTGYYSNWRTLPKEDRDKVLAERARKKNGDKKRKLSEIQTLSSDIASMKRTVAQMISARQENSEVDDDDATRHDAGNCFGGRKGRADMK